MPGVFGNALSAILPAVINLRAGRLLEACNKVLEVLVNGLCCLWSSNRLGPAAK